MSKKKPFRGQVFYSSGGDFVPTFRGSIMAEDNTELWWQVPGSLTPEHALKVMRKKAVELGLGQRQCRAWSGTVTDEIQAQIDRAKEKIISDRDKAAAGMDDE